ncbi:MAG: beta-galactosidase [Candidatus Daviesbacteria bacterium]|nr:beta-galactosidase [Candidatus Daviesbacteria bacterium]
MKKLSSKGVIILCIALVLIAVASLIFDKNDTHPVKFGVTFTPKYARDLKLDWQKTYTQILDNLHVRNLRLSSFWDIIELERGQFNFAETDYLLSEAGKRGARAILVVGARQPRWPECHVPAWAKNLPADQKQKETLILVQKVIERYKDEGSVWAWQVENEPLLTVFGEGCDFIDKNFLKRELELVRSISKKPIIMTDSGELGFWITSMQMSDIFGTTVYRKVYDKWLGYVTYPVPPSFYSIKSNLVRSLFAKNNQKTIIVELQTEPWLANGDFAVPEEQARIFTTQDFKNYVNFSQNTGFDEVYLWGVEWWYYMASHGHPEYLDFARTLFK